MASGRGKDRNDRTEYEKDREARIESNRRRMEALKISALSNELQKLKSTKRKKVCGIDFSFHAVAFGTL